MRDQHIKDTDTGAITSYVKGQVAGIPKQYYGFESLTWYHLPAYFAGGDNTRRCKVTYQTF